MHININMFHCIVLVITGFENNVNTLLGHFVSSSIPNKYLCIRYIGSKVLDSYETLNT